MSRVMLGIDPSNIDSAYCTINMETLEPIQFGKEDNYVFREMLRNRDVSFDCVAIEDLQNMGMPAGRSLFDTAKEIGRLTEILEEQGYSIEYVYRKEEKLHICGSQKANDATIRRALIDRFCTWDFKHGKGTKDRPDFFRGFKADIWMAFCVAVVAVERE